MLYQYFHCRILCRACITGSEIF